MSEIYRLLDLKNPRTFARKLKDCTTKRASLISECKWHDFERGEIWEFWEDLGEAYYQAEILGVPFGYVNIRVIGKPHNKQ